MGGGLGASNANFGVHAMAVFKDELYLGGLTTIGTTTIRKLAKWDGLELKEAASGVFDSMKVGNVVINMASVSVLKEHDGKLYVGGSFKMAGGVSANNIAAWDGSAWTALGAGTNATVSGLEVFDGKLVAVGAFWKAEDLDANRVAAWDGSKWSAMGADYGAGGTCAVIYKNELYSAGSLTYFGQKYISRWTLPASAPTALRTPHAAAAVDHPRAWARALGRGNVVLFPHGGLSSAPGAFDVQGRPRALPLQP